MRSIIVAAMVCQVKFFGGLRQAAGQAQIEVDPGTVRHILAVLCQDKPALGDALFDGPEIKPYLRVMLNGRDIELYDGLDTRVITGDQLAFFPPLAGGQTADRQ